MKNSDIRKIWRNHIEPSYPGYLPAAGSTFLRVVDDLLVHGFAVESSSYSKTSIRASCVIQPLFSFASTLYGTYSRSLTSPEWLDCALLDSATVGVEWMNGIERVAKPLFEMSHSLDMFIKNQRRLARGADEMTLNEDLAGAATMNGDYATARRAAKEWLRRATEALAEHGTVYHPVVLRADTLVHLLNTAPAQAQTSLRENVRLAKKILGVSLSQ